MAYPRSIRNFNAFLDGIGYFGRVVSARMPDPTLVTADFRGGGMDMAIRQDMGMEPMDAEISFKEWAPELLGHFGTRPRLVLRGGAMGEDDFEADSVIFTLRGRVTKQGSDEFKAGSENMLMLGLSVDQFRLEINGEVKHDIDAEAGKRIIDGVDQLASMRIAMGI